MPDIHDLELDARPDWSEIYGESVSCKEHGTETVRNITVYYKDLKTNKKTEKEIEFCIDCAFEMPGENQEFNKIGETNEQIEVRSNAR